MRYISTFSGIEAASCAWEELGWEPVAFSEIEPFPCAVLEHHYPDVPNLGDITQIDWTPYAGTVDLVVGGSPCQSFSIAGNRGGLQDERGWLMFEYVRAVREIRPRYFVWENVPGALSSEGGAAFGQLLREMDELGYGLAWRVLDAQFFGVAQRRRRVFLVGCLDSSGCRAGEILFEPETLRWNLGSSKQKRKELAEHPGSRPPVTLKLRHTGSECTGGGSGPLMQIDVSATLATHQDQTLFQPVVYDTTQINSKENGCNPQPGDPCHPLCSTAHPPLLICATDTQTNSAIDGEVCGTLTRRMHKDPPVVTCLNPGVYQTLYSHGSGGPDSGAVLQSSGSEYIVRRLMPVECERLQGFPDGWTDVEYKGKPAKDTPRYKSIGNSMAVPEMLWIGKRIEEVDAA